NSHSEFEVAIRDSPPIPNFIFRFLPSSSRDVSQFFPFQISTSSSDICRYFSLWAVSDKKYGGLSFSS
ncbi:hypothetical protein ES288_D12G060900v1, partial [Gossypium darwinii]